MNPPKKFTVGIYTLGCKVNQYESEAIAEALEKDGVAILPPSEVCDGYIINTCTVTAESDRKARQFIRRAISKNENAFIVVTGCFAQTSPQAVAQIKGVDAIIGNTQKLLSSSVMLSLLRSGEKRLSPEIIVGNIDESGFESMEIKKFERTRAYVKIEDGCENRCTYCIIPSARGKVRSRKPDELIAEVTALSRSGCREIVLTGIETASYGKDLGNINLEDILCRVANIDGIGRIRLGSLDPSLIREDFAKKIASLDCIAPHFHLSLQSGSSRILALMKRKYNADMAMRSIELLRKYIPDVKFTTDVIVGFPGETEEDFEQTVEFVRKAGFLTVHIFPYSARQGTPAARMKEQIPSDEKSRRLHTLEAAEAEARSKILDMEIAKGKPRQVLFESFDGEYAHGHTADFLEVAVRSDRSLHAELINVTLERHDGRICYGHIQE